MITALCFVLCTISVNYPYDAVGTLDSRPGTWGTAGYDDGKITFNNPPGTKVRILRVYGNFTARLEGHAAAGSYAGALFGLLKTTTGPSSHATYSASGCLLYLQLDVNQSAHAEFDTKVEDGLLPDGVLLVRRAVYLNETGLSLHSEPSFIVCFRWEKE